MSSFQLPVNEHSPICVSPHIFLRYIGPNRLQLHKRIYHYEREVTCKGKYLIVLEEYCNWMV